MSTSIIKDKENEFTQLYCTDENYKKIVSELTTRKAGSTTGRKITLTTIMLNDFLYYVSMNNTLKDSAEICLMGENNRKDYAQRSATFSYLTSQAATFLPIQLKTTMVKAALGSKPGYFQYTHPGTGKVEYMPVKDTAPNLDMVKYLAEKLRIFGVGDDGEKQPQLGAPRNEEEAKLLELLLNRHYDYVKAKEAKE